VREEQKSNKSSISNLNILLQKEEDTILKKQKEMNDLEVNLQQLRIKQENTETRISDVTKEIESFLFQFTKFQKSTQNNPLVNDTAQQEIKRITEKYDVEARNRLLK
jgi:isopentenyl phosphate kinase